MDFMMSLVKYLLLAAFGAFPLMAQTDSLEQQRKAAAAMEESLARQRTSVQKQLGQGESKGFFILPRPRGMGVTTPAPAMAYTPAPGDTGCDALPVVQVDSLIGETAEREGVDKNLLRGVMYQESGFHPCAVSAKGAMGLMQLMPATAAQFGVTDPFNPVENVTAGARLLKQLMTRYDGDLNRVLGAYNAGPARVDAADGIPGIPETWNYVNRILSLLPAKQ